MVALQFATILADQVYPEEGNGLSYMILQLGSERLTSYVPEFNALPEGKFTDEELELLDQVYTRQAWRDLKREAA